MNKVIKRIWMIDDSSTDMYLQEELMRRRNIGTSFSHFISAEKVIELLNILAEKEEQELPDLILLDIHMPRVDGFGFLEAYSKAVDSFKKHPVLVVISSTIMSSDIQKMKNHPLVSGVLKKPLEVDQLRAILEA